MSGPALALRPVAEIDRARLARWLKDPHVQRWWGSAAAAEAEVRMALTSPTALCRIIIVDGEAVGYVQAHDTGCGPQGASITVPAGTWMTHVFIAVAEQRGRGLAPAALRLLASEVFATTLAPAVALLVPVRIETAVRSYEKAGMRWARVEADPLLGPCWLMLLSRPCRAERDTARANGTSEGG